MTSNLDIGQSVGGKSGGWMLVAPGRILRPLFSDAERPVCCTPLNSQNVDRAVRLNKPDRTSSDEI